MFTVWSQRPGPSGPAFCWACCKRCRRSGRSLSPRSSRGPCSVQAP